MPVCSMWRRSLQIVSVYARVLGEDCDGLSDGTTFVMQHFERVMATFNRFDAHISQLESC
jgi:hypothetical protein